MHDSLTDFQWLAQRLFGPEPVRSAARFLDVASRTAQRWAQGDPAPDRVVDALRDELNRVEQTGAYEIAEEAFSRILASGLDPETASGVMKAVAHEMRKKS